MVVLKFKLFLVSVVLGIIRPGSAVIDSDVSPCENLLQGDPSSLSTCLQEGNFTVGFKKTCIKHGGQEAYDHVLEELTNFHTCFGKSFDIEAIKEEMEEAEPVGDIDSVLRKYCERTPDFYACLRPVLDSFQLCLDEQEKLNLKYVEAAINGSVEFICHQSGDRIALFMSEDGFQCLSNNHEQLLNCSSNVADKNVALSASSASELVSFDPQSCRKYHSFRECFSDVLKDCDDPTPGNLADSLMQAALKATPCQASSSTASIIVESLLLIFVGYLLVS